MTEPSLESRVYELQSAGRIADAIALTKDAISVDPKDWLAWSLLGNSLRDWEDYDGAIAAHSRYVEIRPADAIAYASRSLTHLKKGNVQDAVRDVKRALSIDASAALVLAAMVDAFSAAGCPDEAVGPLEAGRATNSDPDIVEMLGSIYLQCIVKRWTTVGDMMLCTSAEAAEATLQIVAKANGIGIQNPETRAHLAEVEKKARRALGLVWARSIGQTLKGGLKVSAFIAVLAIGSSSASGTEGVAISTGAAVLGLWLLTGFRRGWKVNQEVAARPLQQ